MAVRNEAIQALFKYLGGLGYRRPDSWNPDIPGNPSKADIFASWRHTFRNASAADLLAAGIVHVDNGNKWWPNAGELVALIPPSGPPLLGCDAAWTRASENLKRIRPPWHPERPWRLADRDDEHAAAVVALKAAGWVNLCNSNEQRLNYAKRDFGIAFAAEMARTTAARRWREAQGGARQLTGDAPRRLLTGVGS